MYREAEKKDKERDKSWQSYNGSLEYYSSYPLVKERRGSQSVTRPDQQTKKILRKSKRNDARKLEWAIDDEKKQRGYAVTELYPRLLYTFSDTVVFVIRNPR